MATYLRLDIDNEDALVTCALRRPSMWLLVALLLAVFGSVALGCWASGNASAALGLLIVGLVIVPLGAALTYGFARDEEHSLMAFVRQAAVDAAQGSEPAI
jgi:hypothetical protein